MCVRVCGRVCVCVCVCVYEKEKRTNSALTGALSQQGWFDWESARFIFKLPSGGIKPLTLEYSMN